jgi:hypothetical protein
MILSHALQKILYFIGLPCIPRNILARSSVGRSQLQLFKVNPAAVGTNKVIVCGYGGRWAVCVAGETAAPGTDTRSPYWWAICPGAQHAGLGCVAAGYKAWAS